MQMHMTRLVAEKVHAENRADKMEEEQKTLQGKFDNLWNETNRLYDLTSGKAIQDLSMVLEKLQVAVDVIKQDQIDIFEGATEGGGVEMDAEILPTPIPHWLAVCWQHCTHSGTRNCRGR